MFRDCTGLRSASKLPAKRIVSNAYEQMFIGCTGLETAPEIMAEHAESYACVSMFSGCTSLKKVPDFHTKTLGFDCYAEMFKQCSSLRVPPALPATTVEWNCYREMFASSGLTTLPKLPAKKLITGCYRDMFRDCRGLIINTEAPGKKWSIAKGTSDESADSWNSDMFNGTGGNFTDNPQIGVTYYIFSDNETTGISSVKTDNDKQPVKVVDKGKILIVNGNKKYTVSGLDTE